MTVSRTQSLCAVKLGLARSGIWSRWLAAVLLAVQATLSGCDSSLKITRPTPPDSTGGGGGGGGGVERASLTLIAVLTGQDSVLAEQLGSPGGVLRNAFVTIGRSGSSTRQSATTDSTGRVQFDRLLPGVYGVSVIRLLTPAESATLSAADADVNAFGGGAIVTVAAPVTDTAVTVLAGRRGSLVISEVSASEPFFPSGGQYEYASYIELYNNSDTTIYLDGMVIGRGMNLLSDFSSPRSCIETAKWRDDPAGIWTKFLDAFPGAGRDHPLAPGNAVVVATDAINHGQFLAGLPDLSGADYEFHGSNDVDNPGVLNMLDIGLYEYGVGLLGHGLDFRGPPTVVFAALPLDVASLPRDNLPQNNFAHVRVPGDQVLDVLSYDVIPSLQLPQFPPCPQFVNSVFDRQSAPIYDWRVVAGMQRRVFTTLPDGRAILLRTKTSANDFMFGPPTPRGVP
jgi:hypothetical protein